MAKFMEWLHNMVNPEPLETQFPSTFAEALVHVPPVTPEMKQPVLDLPQMYETIQAKQDLAIANGMRQRSAEVTIPTDLPVTVFMVGDIHHGSIFTNEQMWRSHKEQIEQTPGAYIALMHNLPHIACAERIDLFSHRQLRGPWSRLRPPIGGTSV